MNNNAGSLLLILVWIVVAVTMVMVFGSTDLCCTGQF